MPSSWASLRWVSPCFSRMAFRPIARTSTLTWESSAPLPRHYVQVRSQVVDPGARNEVPVALYGLEPAGSEILPDVVEVAPALNKHHASCVAQLIRLEPRHPGLGGEAVPDLADARIGERLDLPSRVNGDP